MQQVRDFLISLGYGFLDNWSENGEGYKFLKKEPDGKKIQISVFIGKKGRKTVSKRDIADHSYNNYIHLTPLELKFFDSLDFEASYWHNYHTDQTAQDWFNAGEVELKF